MTRENRFELGWLIVLPVLVALAFNLQPRPAVLEEALVSARLARAERFPEAYNAYLYQALEVEPWRGELWEEIGMHELAQGKWGAAIEAFGQAERQRGLSPAGLVSLGAAYEAAGAPDRAIAAYLDATSQKHPPEDAFRRAADLQRAGGDFAGAAGTLRLWLAQGEGDPETGYQLGVLEALRDVKAARATLEGVEGEGAAAGKAEALGKDLRRAGEGGEGAYHTLLVGRALARQGEWDAAAALFERATREAPDYAEAWAFLGQARQQNGQEGREALERAFQLDPHSVAAQSLLALYWRQHNQPGLALVYLNRLAQQNPAEAVWELELGNVLTEMGSLISAAEHFERAVEREPGRVDAWRALAEFAVVHQFEPRNLGLPAARKVLLLTPHDPAALDLMGWVLLNLGDATSAERFLHQGLQKDARYAPAYLHLGQLYLQQDQSTLAGDYLRKAALYADPGSAVETIAQRLLGR